jgi:translation elongation factor EF-Tu-like GTPase
MTQKSFRLTITDVFPYKSVSAVVLGTVEQGEVSVGDTVLVALAREEAIASVVGIEVFRAVLTKAIAGQEIGLQLKGIDPGLLAVGAVVKSVDSN